MTQRKIAPYGSWRSPISARAVAAAALGLEQVLLDGEAIYWVEKRPTEGGRQVIVRLGANGHRRDVTPPPFNARTRVHEYGGLAYRVAAGRIVFSNDADGRLYAQSGDAPPTALTPEGAFRYGEPIFDGLRGRVICVREDCTPAAEAGGEPVDAIVAVTVGDGPLSAVGQEDDGGARDPSLPAVAGDDRRGAVRVLVSGSDFYAAPRLSPDGSRLAWLAWNHPNMPWDSTELWVGELGSGGEVCGAVRVAGGPEESVFQPEWGPDGALYFVSDRSGWWNLYRWRAGQVEALHPMAAEFGAPMWVLGERTYDFAAPDQIISAYCQAGRWHLARLDTVSLAFEPIPQPYTLIASLRAGNGQAVFIGASPAEPASVVWLDLRTGRVEALRRSAEVPLDAADLSLPEAIEFPTAGGRTAHAFFYPPRNRAYAAPPGERPPLLVVAHGGPTGAASTALSLNTQFWTSRGVAVAHVNYGGSTGYGRAYRQRLDGQWGVVDVEDCVNAARYLAAQGLVDGNRMAIRGGSAGGYTVLCALTFHDLFRAGAVLYGIGDLALLARETHKFESRYLDRLVGPPDEAEGLYRQRSPIHHADRLTGALILFQGLDDPIVPPSQSEAVYRTARAKGLPVAYLTFAGEGHGFRRAETIARVFEAELFFLSQVFGFALAEPVEPVPIENLSAPDG